jgi:hypothetical protein
LEGREKSAARQAGHIAPASRRDTGNHATSRDGAAELKRTSIQVPRSITTRTSPETGSERALCTLPGAQDQTAPSQVSKQPELLRRSKPQAKLPVRIAETSAGTPTAIGDCDACEPIHAARFAAAADTQMTMKACQRGSAERLMRTGGAACMA